MNVTELSDGAYPFPSDKIIANKNTEVVDSYRYVDIRKHKTPYHANKLAYRIFPDGHLEDLRKLRSYDSILELSEGVCLHSWEHWSEDYCGVGQTALAKDPESARYREDDGSILFSPFVQADFFFVPTKYADEFAMAAELHLKHRIWIECAFNTITDMVRRMTDAQIRSTNLCTEWSDLRGTGKAVSKCIGADIDYGFVHPFKIAGTRNKYSKTYSRLQTYNDVSLVSNS